MNRKVFWSYSWVLVVLLSLSFPLRGAVETEAVPDRPLQPATAAATTQPDIEALRAQAETLRKDAFASALTGKFEEALQALHRANELAPEQEDMSSALGLVKDYVTRRADWDSEHQAELVVTVQRVRLSLLADSARPELTKEGLDEKLRKEVRDIISAYVRPGGGDALEQARDSEAEEIRSKTLEALGESRAALERATGLLETRHDEYAESFLRLAEKLSRSLRGYEQMWAKVELDTPRARRAGARKLADLEDNLIDALADLEAMTAEKPWRVALRQAGTAREIAPDPKAIAEEDWYRDLVRKAEQIGQTAKEEANWRDALSAYTGLQRLGPNNEEYKKEVKTVRRHVRVLSLYGADSSATQPARPRWEEMVDSVDVDLVRVAMNKLHRSYVSRVDFRKLGKAALMSVRVLAETPQAAKTFPGLGDEEKRQSFLAAIQRQEDFVNRKDRFAEDELALALNSVVRASERTVQIPTSVVAMEFADGLLDELDEFSSMVWPDDVDNFEKTMRGRFHGVGIQISKEKGQPLKVVTPLLNTPAYRAGIKTGDLILAVDGEPTEHLKINKLVEKIMGEKGTTVVLRIKRPGTLEPKDVKIVRDEIHIRTVKGWKRKGDGRWDYMIDPDSGIGYLRVTQFTEDTHQDVKRAFDQMRKAGLRSLVLDLRLNPGGLLQEAVKLADEFLRRRNRNDTIVYTQHREVPQSRLRPSSSGRFLDGDVVVLVHKKSASAAEIVSGAIQDYERGLLVGERTYGKGSVQKVIKINGHSAFLKLTTAYYYLPKGRLVHRKNNSDQWGVDPDIAVRVSPGQLLKWQVIQSKTDLIRDIEPDELGDELARQYDADIQLRTAVLLLKLMRLQKQEVAVSAR